MTLKKRPDPEELLLRAQEEERQQKRGKLKIYLGAAPGVGKTYTMLRDAIDKRGEGLDVVVGIAESHGRKEIEALLKALEILPRQSVEYRDKYFYEFDLDAALKRAPALILIDEMAHSNVPGLRHSKRWQDIKEILDRGIDVYTTLNVQHIESLNDVVAQVVGIRVKETVPDSMLELVDTIEVVDLTPEDLLKRLHEGKIYFPAQAGLAVEHYFQKGNLIALRELALRATAESVGAQVLLYRHGQGIERIWPTRQRILVCIDAGAQAQHIIRSARRIATSLKAEWIAVYVETPRMQTTEGGHHAKAIENLRFAEQLGAETRILNGINVAQEIINFARDRNVTQILIGKKRHRIKDLFWPSLANQLIRQSGDIDVYIIHGDWEGAKLSKSIAIEQRVPWKIYALSLVVVSIATLIDLIFSSQVDLGNLMVVYLLGVVLIAMFGCIGPSIFAFILSALAYDFFFVPPKLSFAIGNIPYFITMLLMLLLAQIITHMAIITRRQAQIAQVAERRTATLQILSRQLAMTRGLDPLLKIAVRFLSEVFDAEVIALLPEDNTLKIRASYKVDGELASKEMSITQWVYDLGQSAGLGTDTLPISKAIYVPLLASQGVVGVFRLLPSQPERLLIPEQMHLLEACTHQIALALEVDRLHEQTRKSELKVETDRIRSLLLQSVSHDLRTPLLAILGYARTLTEVADELPPQSVKKLGRDIYFESEQLNRLINNLLQMTYLEAESVKLQKDFYVLDDVLNVLIKTLSKELGKRNVNLKIPPNFPKIPFDKTLMEQVFLNILDNAIKYTPPDSPIEMDAYIEKNKVFIRFADRGPGLTPYETNKLFEKFYRGHVIASERGMGLGLSICRSIVKAHSGKIWAENREEGGAIFYVCLPLS